MARISEAVRGSVVAIFLLWSAAFLSAQSKETTLRFEVSFPKELSATPLDGRVLLLLSTDASDEPRYQIREETAESEQAFGIDVEGMAPGKAAVIDASAFGYPTISLAKIKPGDYNVQALLNIYETFHLGNGHTVKLPPDKGEGQHWQTKPGNLFSKPMKMHIDPQTGSTIRIALTEKIAPIEDNLARVDGLLDWGRTSAVHPRDSKWVKHIRVPSPLLTKFWGKPTELGAVVLLPPGFEEHPNAHYPLIVEQDHFHRDLFLPNGFQTEPPSPDSKGPERMYEEYSYKFFQDWTSGRMPHAIVMTIQHPTPYFDDSYAVNSANQGPYGDAITEELIPYVEKNFRAIGQGWARVVYGGSTGGWEALASQVFYPDFYDGAWVFCPDVVDFRAYPTTNLYDDKNAYFVEGPFGDVPRPEQRDKTGMLFATMEGANYYELVLGTHGRSGEQFDIWQATFSPAGEDGYPKPIFDKRTGVIDHDVANYWKEHYDLSAILQRDWRTLGPKVAGKMHFYVGEADTWYLDRAVHLLRDFLENTTEPYAHATFDFGIREPHCYSGAGDSNGPAGLTIPQRLYPDMVKQMEKYAPAGADLTSWKY